ncbi:ankyrin repeat-containing domain protein [Aspergillus coremiiformis]|uniref:Ankyrin repeat-containing domain protein n=1 Tax=Aspergillus coremiiformis TaxID=138285 RepID=A0A5N6YXC9_9EURO|nr:ankyrin repeat-containing domain protein [Aspergillus coremiiformis]
MPRFEFDSSLYDPLSITSLYGSGTMLRTMLENSDFRKDNFLSESTLRAADQILQWGDVSKLRILFLHERLCHQLQNLDFFRLVLRRWSNAIICHHDWDLVFGLVDYVSDKLIQEQWGNELLCVAAGAGCMPLIRRLITSAQDKAELRQELLREFRFEQPPATDKPTHQSIGEAVLGNHVDVVACLIRENGIEAHLRYRNSRGENVLHLATRLCNPEMFRLLIPRFEEGIHQADDQGHTPLVRIIMNSSASRNRYESARILLLHSGADWNRHYSDGQQDPLRAAVRLGDVDMCCLLMSIGSMDPLSALTWDSKGQMGLKDRTPENEGNKQQILQLLCSHAKIASTSAQC